MSKRPDPRNLDEVLASVRELAAAESVRVTQHAHQEMVEEGFTIDDVLHAIKAGRILENYPDHRRGACALLYGLSAAGRQVHVLCTTALPVVIIITVYEPRPPKWQTATQRSRNT